MVQEKAGRAGDADSARGDAPLDRRRTARCRWEAHLCRSDGWGYGHTLGFFATEEEALAFIEKHAHLPQAFDIVKSYEGPK